MRWRELLHLNETEPLPASFLSEPRRIHFIGVGGIGMSALAFLLRERGHEVSGSDASESAILARLREAGVTTFVGQAAANVGRAQAVIYSSAISPDNPEFTAARAAGIPVWHRSQLLAYFVNGAARSIAVTGTHGKSTTSAMVAHILAELGHNPTAILGAVYPPFHSNYRSGDPDLLVVEADESDGSFTLLHPTVGVVLNLEPEHLENYSESPDELWRAFRQFVAQSAQRVINADQAGLAGELGAMGDGAPVLTYSLDKSVPASLHAGDIEPAPGHIKYRLLKGEEETAATFLTVPGVHNVSNALAAASAALAAEGVAPQDGAAALSSFAGTLRRFERKGEAAGVVFYDDYGHHPTEVRATLEAASAFLARPLTVIFQPHRYSRTRQMGHEFGASFGAAQTIIITQLYSAFEEPIPGVSGRIVYDAVRAANPDKTVLYAEDLNQAQALALENLRQGDALLTMGAGDITGLGPRLMRAWEEQNGG